MIQEPHASRQRITGRLLIGLAAVLWSTSGFFAKATVFDSWPVAERGLWLAFWRAVFASLVLIPMVRRPTWSPALIPMVLVFAAMNLTFLSALSMGEAANAIWLQYTSPVWVFLVGTLVFRETVHPRDAWMLGFAVLGIAVILYFGQATANRIGVLCGLASGVFFAGVVLCVRQLRAFDSAWLIALNHVTTVVLLAPYVLSRAPWPSGHQWPFLLCFGVFQMGLPYVLFARGLRAVPGHEATCITLLEPLLVPVWVYLAWDQRPAVATLTGGALILCGLLLRYLPNRGRPDP